MVDKYDVVFGTTDGLVLLIITCFDEHKKYYFLHFHTLVSEYTDNFIF